MGNGAVARLMARYLSVVSTGCAREALSSLDALFAAVSGPAQRGPSPSTFREQFRRAAQVTPSEYRATFSGYPPHDNDKRTR